MCFPSSSCQLDITSVYAWHKDLRFKSAGGMLDTNRCKHVQPKGKKRLRSKENENVEKPTVPMQESTHLLKLGALYFFSLFILSFVSSGDSLNHSPLIHFILIQGVRYFRLGLTQGHPPSFHVCIDILESRILVYIWNVENR